MFFFFLFYVGAEMVFAKLSYTFALCYFNLTRDSASLMVFVFWLCFTICRFLAALQCTVILALSLIVLLNFWILIPTLSAWPLDGHSALTSILWETLFLYQLHDFSLLPLNLFLHPFWRSKFMKENSLTPKKKFIMKNESTLSNL